MDNIGIEGLLRQYINNSVKGLFTALPCRVTSVAGLAQQRINVQPIINKIKTSDEELEQPIIQNVPLIFPGSSSSQFTFPINVGDTVLCVFSQRSLDRFKLGAKTPHRPVDLRKMSRNDAIAIPGLFPFQDALNNPSNRSLSHSTQDAVVTHNIGSGSECEVRLKPSGDVIINSPTTVQVNCQDAEVNAESSSTINTQTSTVNTSTAAINASSSVTIDTPSTTVTGNMLVQGTFTYTGGMVGSGSAGGSTASITGSVEVSDDVTASGVSLVSHTHSGVESGPDDTGTPN